MEIKELITKEDKYSRMVVTSSIIGNEDPIYSVIQTNIITGIRFGEDIFDTKRKLNNYLKRFNLKI